MSRIERYKDWIQIKIDHEYYDTGNIPLDTCPSREIAIFFNKSGILFRQYMNNQWNILIPEGETPEKQLRLWLEDNIIMNFELKPSTPEFLYISSLVEINNKYYSVKNSVSRGGWKQLEIPLTEIILKQSISIDISVNSLKKHLEFILIPKYNSINIQLQLTEEKGKLQFSKERRVSFLNNIEAYQFKTTEPVVLRNGNPYKIKLWEIRKTGNRLLSDIVPLPMCNEASIFDPYDTVTTYFYY